MWRPPLAALLLLSLAGSARAAGPDSLYEGPDTEKETRFRRLFTPWEFGVYIESGQAEVAGDPAVAGFDAAKKERARATAMRALAAVDGASPDYEAALREMASLRSTLFLPVTEAYLAASANAAPGAALGAFEREMFAGMRQDWLPQAYKLDLITRRVTPEPSDARAFLRAEAAAYKRAPPAGRVDTARALASVRTGLRGVFERDEATLSSLYTAAGMRRTAAPADARMSNVNDRAARLRAVMPMPAYSDLERTILATVLTDAALAEVVSGRSTLDLHKEALDAANLAMADQSHAEIQAAIRGKTLFAPGSLATLRSSVPPADMSRYVCGAMGQQQRAPELTGGQGTARADLERTAAQADVIRVETTALPGIAQYCRDSAALRAPPQTGPATTPDTRPVTPQQRIGPMANVPGTGKPMAEGEGGGLGGKLKQALPYAAIGAAGGLVVAAALGAGPAGLVAGLLLGALFGGGLGIFGNKG